MFFSDDPIDMARAKAICSVCGLAERCLDAALARGEVWGVWGGEFLVDGQIVAVNEDLEKDPALERLIALKT